MAYNNRDRKPRFNRRNDDAPKGAGLYVEVRNNDVEKALRRLKKMINNDGLMKTLKQKEYYEKPSEIKQRKKAEAKKRWQKKLKKLEKLGIVN